MRQLLFNADAYIARWVEERSPYCRFDKFTAIGVVRDQKIIAGVVYHNYIPDFGNIEMSIAADSPMWASKQIISSLLAYPFLQLDCKRITACVASKNQRSLKMVLGLGFKREGLVRKGYGDDHMVITGMLRKEAKKWTKET